jgi:hypothetical protein
METQTYIITNLGTDSADQTTEQKIPINMYASRLVDEHKRIYSYCLVLQPIVVAPEKQTIN